MGAILSGADLTNAVVDRVDFSNAKLDGAKFVNAVVTGVIAGWQCWCWSQHVACCRETCMWHVATRVHPAGLDRADRLE